MLHTETSIVMQELKYEVFRLRRGIELRLRSIESRVPLWGIGSVIFSSSLFYALHRCTERMG
jgi:hypothetical protein